MPEQAKARVGGAGNGGADVESSYGYSSIITANPEHRPILDVAYRSLDDFHLDIAAERAIRLAWWAGRMSVDPDLPESHRDILNATVSGYRLRLIERCRVMESAEQERLNEKLTAAESAQNVDHAKWIATRRRVTQKSPSFEFRAGKVVAR
jgi:hypothetical protein